MCHFSLMGAKVVKSWQLAVISCQFLGDVLGRVCNKKSPALTSGTLNL